MQKKISAYASITITTSASTNPGTSLVRNAEEAGSVMTATSDSENSRIIRKDCELRPITSTDSTDYNSY